MLFSNPTPADLIGITIALVLGITVHEFSHAWLADRLGDHRPRALGRVSLDPRRHIDPLGALFFLIAGFGWGRPVPVNAYALRPGRIGMAMVASAGPAANLVTAALVGVVFQIVAAATTGDPGGSLLVRQVLYAVVFWNVALGFFNLLPIPPLDGYNIGLPLLPTRTAFTVQRYAQYGFVLLLLLIVMPGPIDWLFELAATISVGFIGA